MKISHLFVAAVILSAACSCPAFGQNPNRLPGSGSGTNGNDTGSSADPTTLSVGSGSGDQMDLREATPVVIRSRDTSASNVRQPTSPVVANLPPEPPSPFQNFVVDTLGHPLKIFGSDLFAQPSTDFAAASSVEPPSDYVIGPGDVVNIRAWGKVSIDVQATVDRQGQLYVPQVGALNVAGLRVDQLTDFINAAISRQFRGFNSSITLGQLRSIQIYVLGQARKPGVYTVSSLSTLVNALFESGGPSSTGSLRDIQLKRGGQVITHFDVYALVLRGDKSADVHLLPGDILFIPQIGPQIAVDGDVTTPGIFEMKGGATAADALQSAGGITALASTARATLDRVVDHKSRRVDDFPLNGAEQTITLQSDDILRVFPVTSKIDGAVTLSGTMGHPGRYQWRAGMRVSDLIPTRDYLLPRSYFNQQNTLGAVDAPRPFSGDGMAVANKGVTTRALTDAQQSAAASGLSATTTQNRNANQSNGQVTTSASNGANNGMAANSAQAAGGAVGGLFATGDVSSGTASALAPQTGGAGNDDTDVPKDLASHATEINWNYAVIERLGEHDLTTQLIPFVLGDAIDHPDSVENKQLQAGDVVVVYSRDDINLPQQLRAKFVRIDGEVNKAGVYRVEENETLRDLVRRAGGLTPHSFLYAAQFTRVSLRLEQEAKLRNLIEEETRSVLSPVNANHTITSTGGGVSDLPLRQAYIAALSRLRPTGRVVLELPQSASSVDDLPELTLQDGDHLFVPGTPNTVDVLGSVYNQGTFRYVAGGRVHKYLNAAGAETREGDKNREYVLRADGTIISRNHSGSFEKLTIYPGDSVIVPAKLRPGVTAADIINLAPAFASVLSVVALAVATR